MKPVTLTLIAAALLSTGLPAAAQIGYYDQSERYDSNNQRYDQRSYDQRYTDQRYVDQRYTDQSGYDQNGSDYSRSDDHHDRGERIQWLSNDWSGYGYNGFNREYRRIQGLIDHALRDGSFDRRQARVYSQTANEIRIRAEIQQRRGTFSARETRMLLNRLLERMRIAHGRRHDQQDRYDDYRR